MDNSNEVVKQQEALTTQPTQPESSANEVTEEKQVKAGDKTEPNLLLESLQKEREKRRQLEAELEQAKENLQKTNTSSSFELNEAISDEGRFLQKKVDELSSQLRELNKDNQRKDLLLKYPVLKDKWADFEEYLEDPDNKGMNLKTAAKAFLHEKDLLVENPQRQGLEDSTGGAKTPTSSTMTVEDVENLRRTNYKKYTDMLMKGLIKIGGK